MALSSAFSTQAQMLSPAQLALIEEDYAKNPNTSGGPPTVRVGRNGKEITGPLYANDRTNISETLPADPTDEQFVGFMGMPPAAAMLDKAGALSRTQQVSENTADVGALSKTASPRPAPPDIAEMLRQYMPQDDSQSRYLALAQGLLAPTKTGSFGEQLSNVAGAMQQQKVDQEKTRAQYVPLIMQQVAAQQAREEQNQYRLEAQQQAQQAAKLAALQQQQARIDQAALDRQAQAERSAADRASRETIASNHNELMTTLKGPSIAASKPLPPVAVKMQNDDLEVIGTFSGLDADLQGLQKQIEEGKLSFGLFNNLANSARNYTGNSTEESRNLASFKTKLENMRNSVLLLNKGVQTEGDAQRAMNEIIANINDKELVKQRLAEIRALNARAVQLQKGNIDLLRDNYGHPPLDFSKYDVLPPAVGDNKPGAPAKPTGDLLSQADAILKGGK